MIIATTGFKSNQYFLNAFSSRKRTEWRGFVWIRLLSPVSEPRVPVCHVCSLCCWFQPVELRILRSHVSTASSVYFLARAPAFLSVCCFLGLQFLFACLLRILHLTVQTPAPLWLNTRWQNRLLTWICLLMNTYCDVEKKKNSSSCTSAVLLHINLFFFSLSFFFFGVVSYFCCCKYKKNFGILSSQLISAILIFFKCAWGKTLDVCVYGRGAGGVLYKINEYLLHHQPCLPPSRCAC